MNKNLRKIMTQNKEKKSSVLIKPCNEKQELNFIENFTGTPKQIICRSIEIIKGLEMLFKKSDFSVKIENLDVAQTLCLESGILFDSNFNELGSIEDFLNV